MSFFSESSAILRSAIDQGLIDPVLYPFRDRDYLIQRSMALIEALARQRMAIRIDPSTFELATQPRSERWQEHSFPPVTHIDTATYWAVEVARIIVPKGDIGLLNRIDQVIYDAHGDYYPTASPYWGEPYPLLRDLTGTSWFLQIEYFNGTQPERYNRASAVVLTRANLPGQPYPELPEIYGLFYAAQNPAGNLKAVIPGNRMLRLYFVTLPTAEPLNYQWTVSGRLRATLQTTYCPEAAANIRRS